MDKALEFYEKDLKVTEELYSLAPDNVSFKNGLAWSYLKLGETFHEKRDFQKAKKFLDKAIELFWLLTKHSPDYVEITANLGESYYELSRLYLSMEDCKKAQKSANVSQEIFEDLAQKYSQIKEFQKLLTKLYEHMEKIKKECK